MKSLDRRRTWQASLKGALVMVLAMLAHWQSQEALTLAILVAILGGSLAGASPLAGAEC